MSHGPYDPELREQLRRERAEQDRRDARARLEEMSIYPVSPPVPVRIYGEPVPEQEDSELAAFYYALLQNDAITVGELRTKLGMSPLPVKITGVRPRTECECGRDLLPTMKFCDACGRPLSYTGKTERLA